MSAWRAIEDAAGVLTDQLAGKIADVATAESVTLVSDFEGPFKRHRAETAWKRGKATVSLWAGRSQTRAVSQARRRWRVSLSIDYTFQGQDVDEVARQVGLTARAIMLCVDLLPTTSTLATDAASEDEFSSIVSEDIDDLLQEASGDVSRLGPVLGGVRITVPLLIHEAIT